MIRLDKYLANLGLGTRKIVKEIIKKGLIKVNDLIIKEVDYKVDIKKDVVKYKEDILEYKKYRYIMLNKPKGYISATFDDRSKTVLDLIKGYETYELFPVGRLDKDTEGLLLLTNDGKLAHNLLSPKKHVSKTYYVSLKEEVSLMDIKILETGVLLDDGYLTKKAKIKAISYNTLYITITEGKFHQIKRMFKAINNEVVYLKRISMGNLILDENLKLGEYRELTDIELKGLKE